MNNQSNIERRVRRLYWTAFNRVPDPGGFVFWSNALMNAGNRTAQWQWMVDYFVYGVVETDWQLAGTIGRERGPC